MSKPIHIAREGVKLGLFDSAEVRALLDAGFLKPTDDFWRAGMTEWRSLTELEAENVVHRSPGGEPGWNVGERIRSVAGNAGKLAKKLKEGAKAGSESVAKARARALEDFLPQLRLMVSTHLAQASVRAEAALKDDDLMKRVFGAVFDCLPKPVTRFVAEDQFVKFCMKHKESLVSRDASSGKALGP